MNCKPVSPRISVADTQPAHDAFATLAQEGYAAVVNLREAGEADERMSPAEEGKAVRACGMTYVHVPFSLRDPARATAAVDEFRRQMSAPPGRTLESVPRGAAAGSRTSTLSRVRRRSISARRRATVSPFSFVAMPDNGSAGVPFRAAAEKWSLAADGPS